MSVMPVTYSTLAERYFLAALEVFARRPGAQKTHADVPKCSPGIVLQKSTKKC